MRRALARMALAGLAALLHAPEVRAGAGQAGENVATGKFSGPAVSATVVINPTFGSSNLGETSVRLQKGTSFSSALFFHQEAPPFSQDGIEDGVEWVLGCDRFHGAQVPISPEPNASALTALREQLTADRFGGIRLKAWIPGPVLDALFGQLGISFNDTTRIPVITDVDNPVCTQLGTDFFLSFSAVIQLETH